MYTQNFGKGIIDWSQWKEIVIHSSWNVIFICTFIHYQMDLISEGPYDVYQSDLIYIKEAFVLHRLLLYEADT